MLMHRPKGKRMNSEREPDAAANELGRRLYAAIVSFHLGLKSVDDALKRYTPDHVHSSWGELGLQLQRSMVEAVTAPLMDAIKNKQSQHREIHLVADNAK